MPNSDKTVREQLLHYAQSLNSSGLSVGKSGNISARFNEGFFITPTGVDYNQLNIEDFVWIDLDGNCAPDQMKPSSEWHFHLDVYNTRTDINALVHCHANYSTALACTGRNIPSFHYMVAIAGGVDIPIAPYALFGTEQLSQHVVDALRNRQACLLANHGMIALGENLPKAFNLAVEVETLATQYVIALQLGDVQLLSEAQMQQALDKFKSYGQRL